MRLIDADNINARDVIGGENEFANDIREAVKDLIDRQPTVYDVDKVCRELLDARLSDNMLDCYNAIHIVKRGFCLGADE
jgi:hypothetical protein